MHQSMNGSSEAGQCSKDCSVLLSAVNLRLQRKMKKLILVLKKSLKRPIFPIYSSSAQLYLRIKDSCTVLFNQASLG